MRWKKISEPLNEKVEELSRILAVPKIIASLLLQRGIKDFDTAKHFFRPVWIPKLLIEIYYLFGQFG